VADSLPPASWKEFTEQADEALAAIERMEKTPLPETVDEATEDEFFADPGDGLAGLLGSTDPEELKRWNTRVMSLKDANAILRAVETDLVRSYVLSPKSAFRLMYDGAIKIQRWLIEHTAEITIVLLPLIYKGMNSVSDSVLIELSITRAERAIRRIDEMLSYLYSIVPGKRTGVFGDIFTAAELREAIKAEEENKRKLQREISDLTKMLRKAANYMEFAAEAVLVLAVWFSVEKLLTIAGSATAVSAALAPARSLKDPAILAAQKKAFPQAPQKRTVTYKRSRRN